MLEAGGSKKCDPLDIGSSDFCTLELPRCEAPLVKIVSGQSRVRPLPSKFEF